MLNRCDKRFKRSLITVQKKALSSDICMLMTQIELREDFRIFSKYTPATPARKMYEV